ncbi:hypothetical protein FIBSPDRAFT_955117 [Athelia psychrophila]|uniref:Uncharacterized protein n=1 Tax=Athelia psychrophila TaxID=1759441 RepID=A0A166II65_9AGAM|nr:hypothetical protein FIBSPDRAFT_955117 [Fibularhizoctonia sp. CBS 109695]
MDAPAESKETCTWSYCSTFPSCPLAAQSRSTCSSVSKSWGASLTSSLTFATGSTIAVAPAANFACSTTQATSGCPVTPTSTSYLPTSPEYVAPLGPHTGKPSRYKTILCDN